MRPQPGETWRLNRTPPVDVLVVDQASFRRALVGDAPFDVAEGSFDSVNGIGYVYPHNGELGWDRPELFAQRICVAYHNGREARPGDEVVGTCWRLGTVEAVDPVNDAVRLDGYGWVRANVLLVVGDS